MKATTRGAFLGAALSSVAAIAIGLIRWNTDWALWFGGFTEVAIFLVVGDTYHELDLILWTIVAYTVLGTLIGGVAGYFAGRRSLV